MIYEDQTINVEGLSELWLETKGDQSVCIALLDGPVDQSHQSLASANLIQLETLVSGTADEGLASQHGTHIASIIFGQHNSSIKGIAPHCCGLILPIFKNNSDGSVAPCSQLDLARAINQANNAGADIINISGGEISSNGKAELFLTEAVQNFSDNGGLIIAAAGNDGCDCLHIPGALPSVLAVGAVDFQGLPLEISNWGDIYQAQGILAPGENILGAKPVSGTITQSGTSYATAIISGIAGLLLSLQVKLGYELDSKAVRAAILESAYACNPQAISDCRPFMVGLLNIVGAQKLITKRSKQAAVNIYAQNIGGDTMGKKTQEVTGIREGDIAPEFSVKDHTGRDVDLRDFQGKTVALWFYPQADTPG